MIRKLSTLALAAVLAGSALTGCGGTAATDTPETAQVTAAVRASTKEYEPDSRMDDDHERDAAVSRFLRLLNELRQVPQLAPLFDRFQVPNPVVVEDDDGSAGLVDLLRAVKITVSSGTLTITNRATGGVVFTASRADLDAGTFHAESLPGATAPPPGPTTCTSFTYGAWSACQPNNTQTRSVATYSPAGCTGGSPVTSQACTYTPPLDGAALYGSSCSRCHGALASSNLKGKNMSLASIKSFGMTQGLSDAQLQAIVTAVGP
jgi:hypothetical protein